MSNVLSEEKKQQVIALGRLGWSLRRIQRATSVRRETAAGYLRAAGIEPRPPGGWGRPAPPAAKPANEAAVTTDSGLPASTDQAAEPRLPRPKRSPSASACEAYREAIELGLARGRNAMAIWQDLVSDCGFTSSYQSVKRFVGKLRGAQSPEARVVIVTAPGEVYGESRVMVRSPVPPGRLQHPAQRFSSPGFPQFPTSKTSWFSDFTSPRSLRCWVLGGICGSAAAKKRAVA
jgi:hypothetical protein